jgi:sugar phosphate isomerase/epimerase
MQLAFSTLACPAWTIQEIIAGAVASGYTGIELRGYQESMDLPSAPPFVAENRAHTRRVFAEAGLEICVLGSSALVGKNEVAQVESYAMLAHDLGCPYIRIFSGKPDSFAAAVQTIRSMGAVAAKWGVSLLLETHDDFSTGAAVGKLLQEAAHPALFALWDLHHPYRRGESPTETLTALGPWLRHVHVKDGIAGQGYTLLGEGDVPIGHMLALLRAQSYTGYLSVEWEKRWHPDLPAPEVALPQHATVLRTLT